jgi:hypothetical protein
MIYLQRRTQAGDPTQSVEIAAVEDAQSAACYETRGFVRCSYETFREAWRMRDLRSLEGLRSMALAACNPPHGIYSAPG